MTIRFVLVCLQFYCTLGASRGAPSGWGVNIHFTEPKPGELQQVGQAFRFVRIDFSWAAIETSKGIYSFAAYDSLLVQLQNATQQVRF